MFQDAGSRQTKQCGQASFPGSDPLVPDPSLVYLEVAEFPSRSHNGSVCFETYMEGN